MTAASNEVALLPCPFCGGVPLLMGFNAPEFWVSCVRIGCKAGTEAFGSKDRAIAAWNTRAHSDPRPVAEDMEVTAQLACEAFYGNDWQWGMLDDGFRQKWRDVVAASALATHSPAPMAGEVEKPLHIDWNKHDLAEAYDLIEGVRRKAGQPAESPLDTSLRAALDAVEAADCEWDGLTNPAAVHPSTQEGADHG